MSGVGGLRLRSGFLENWLRGVDAYEDCEKKSGAGAPGGSTVIFPLNCCPLAWTFSEDCPGPVDQRQKEQLGSSRLQLLHLAVLPTTFPGEKSLGFEALSPALDKWVKVPGVACAEVCS
ncbi:hypothetical protein HPB47_005674 [Ixodes persulcatus]|uniref:Uncharacterized protein n=1 Tax=Ixodes persulcatus TaxID=34615 RepID=A0AC60PCB3_IXOPE|nr:hypothetical protein HPB47_005674 [Ixodes persulcatus]